MTVSWLRESKMVSSAEGMCLDGSLGEQHGLLGPLDSPGKGQMTQKGLMWTLSRCRGEEAWDENWEAVEGRRHCGTVMTYGGAMDQKIMQNWEGWVTPVTRERWRKSLKLIEACCKLQGQLTLVLHIII